MTVKKERKGRKKEELQKIVAQLINSQTPLDWEVYKKFTHILSFIALFLIQ